MSDPVGELIDALTPTFLEKNVYIGRTPLTSLERVFGGQVFAQAMRAAQNTVDKTRQVHSQHGYFIRPGDPKLPIIYEVTRVRDGRSFSTRSVNAKQEDKIIFSCLLSFQNPENGLNYQIKMPDCKQPEDCENDNERWERISRIINPSDSEKSKFHRAKIRAIDMRSVNPVDVINPKPEIPEQLIWVKTSRQIIDKYNVGLHQGILAFLSDFNIMATSLMPHGISILNKQLQPASLDHTIWFHDDFIVDDWLLYQLNCDRTGSSRGLTRGYFFERSGKLVASTIQEGLMRIRE